MTLLKLGDLTLILEKVCAYEVQRPRASRSGAEEGDSSLRVLMDGGHELTLHGLATMSRFTKAMKDLRDKEIKD